MFGSFSRKTLYGLVTLAFVAICAVVAAMSLSRRETFSEKSFGERVSDMDDTAANVSIVRAFNAIAGRFPTSMELSETRRWLRNDATGSDPDMAIREHVREKWGEERGDKKPLPQESKKTEDIVELAPAPHQTLVPSFSPALFVEGYAVSKNSTDLSSFKSEIDALQRNVDALSSKWRAMQSRA